MVKLVMVTEVFSCLGNNSRSLAGVNDFPPNFCEFDCVVWFYTLISKLIIRY
jgi:hypothetical protein